MAKCSFSSYGENWTGHCAANSLCSFSNYWAQPQVLGASPSSVSNVWQHSSYSPFPLIPTGKKQCYWQFMYMKIRNENQDTQDSFYSDLGHWVHLSLSLPAQLRLLLDLSDCRIQPCSGECTLFKFSQYLESDEFVWMLWRESFHVKTCLTFGFTIQKRHIKAKKKLSLNKKCYWF